ncbi:uncharacterized protein LOC131332628 [Rhododendron vialii]|uniref:uncharacterized protein LOC131332628 n=1 Tax=Rhododendron vialii TaxID=182163 RepID=UPI00265EF4C2|nr:uncharacterized protein LOC131332628 [Rhododendron vialii]
MEIWAEEGEQDSERRDGPGDEIGSDSTLECIRNFPMYSPPRSLTDWRADQVQSPLLDLCGLQFGYEAYLPLATTTVCNIKASIGFPKLKRLKRSSLWEWPLGDLLEWLAGDSGFLKNEFLEKKGNLSDNVKDSISVQSVGCMSLYKHGCFMYRSSFLFFFLVVMALEFLVYLNFTKVSDSGLSCFRSIDKPINAQALIHSALYSQPCKLNFFGSQATGIYLTVQCFIEKESNAQGFFLEGRYVEAYHRSDIKYFYQSIKKFMRWLDSSEEKMFGGLGVKYIEQKVESAEKSCITISHLKGKSTTERPKRKYRTAYLITLDDLCQLFGHKRADAAKTLGGCWIGAEMNHIVQFLKVEESNAQGYSLEGRCVKANNVMDEKLNSGVQYNQTFERRPGVEIIQLDSSEERIFGELGAKNIGQKVESAEKSCTAISDSKKKNTIETPKRKYRTKRSITLDDLRSLFRQKRADAAKTLSVSVSTFKRYCRQNKITRWNGDGCSIVEPMLVNNSVQQNSSGSKPPEVQGEKEISALLGARQDAVIIKAKYGDGILKFQLSSESGFPELQEAVAKRLKSQAFIVEYEDEDQEPIMITCDEDWQACVKFFGNQGIRLAIREKISNSKKSRGSGRGLKRKMS